MMGFVRKTAIRVAFVTVILLLAEASHHKKHHKKVPHKKHVPLDDVSSTIPPSIHKKPKHESELESMELTAAIKTIEALDDESENETDGPVERSAPAENATVASKPLVSLKARKRRVLDKYKHGGRNLTKLPLPKEGVVANRNAPLFDYLQLGCAEWEGDCEFMYNNASSCDKMVHICKYGYFRSKDGEYCVADDDCYIECAGISKEPKPTEKPPSPGKCGENEEFTQCPQCPDAWCEILTNPWTRECDQREDCYRKENITSNYCRLKPQCQCKKGYVRQYPGNGQKCVPETSCFDEPCKENEHWDRCPRCADLNCDNVHIKNVTERHAPGFCYKAQCLCNEGYVRETSQSGAVCIPVEKCIRCKANEHYNDCPKCEDLQCELLQLANGRKPAASKPLDQSHLIKGVTYCAPPGCKCNKNACPNLPKDYKPEHGDDC
ncbi:allergen Api m 6-like [Ditylenchus destructor]|nr:allergen Api m 6-like [Ditylenchus destructor]